MKGRGNRTQWALLAAMRKICGRARAVPSGAASRVRNRVRGRAAEILRGESGQTLVYMAIFASLVAFAVAAMAIDIGILFQQKRMVQSAADAAAVAAAGEYATDGSLDANAQNAANAAATLNGVSAVPVLSTPSSGNYSNAGSGPAPSTWVQAQVSQSVPTHFMRVLGSSFDNVTVSASAIAGTSQSVSTCVCLEGGGWDLSVNNNAQLDGAQCGLTADSAASNAITIAGSGDICTQSVAAQSSWYNATNVPTLGYEQNGSVCPASKVVQNSTTSCNPPGPAAPTATSCVNDPLLSHSGGGVSYPVGPSSSSGVVCYNSLTIGYSKDTVTLNPGVYIINGGPLDFQSGTQLGGQGVFFYLQQGVGGPYNGQYPSMSMANGAIVNLTAGGNIESNGTTAPSVGGGAYNGYLFDYAASVPCTMSGSDYYATYSTSIKVNTNFYGSGVTNGVLSGSNLAVLTFQGGSTSYIGGEIYAPNTCVSIGNGSNAGVFNGDIVAQSLLMDGGTTLNLSPSATMGSAGSSGAKLTQ